MPSSKHLQYDDNKDSAPMSEYYYHGGDKEERMISRSVLEGIRMMPPGAKRVLDVGCHVGYMGQLIKKSCDVEVCGVEFNPRVAEIARSVLDDVACLDIEEADSLPFEEESFDAITFLDILEHLILPAKALALARKYLKPNGRIICSIPNVRHITVFELLINPNLTWMVKDKGMVTDPPHLRFFTLNDMAAMAEEAGLAIQSPLIGTCSDPNFPLLNDLANRLKGLSIISDADVERLRVEMSVFQFVFYAMRRDIVAAESDLRLEKVPNSLHKLGDLLKL